MAEAGRSCAALHWMGDGARRLGNRAGAGGRGRRTTHSRPDWGLAGRPAGEPQTEREGLRTTGKMAVGYGANGERTWRNCVFGRCAVLSQRAARFLHAKTNPVSSLQARVATSPSRAQQQRSRTIPIQLVHPMIAHFFIVVLPT